MNLLLDTHVWLWSESETSRLRPAAAQAMHHPEARIFLSPISLWEIGVLIRKKRLRLDRTLEAMVASIAPIQFAALTPEVGLEASRMQFIHFDPVDNLLAATARVYGLTLVTADQKLLNTPGLICLPA